MQEYLAGLTREAFLDQMVRAGNTVRNYRRGITLFIGDDDKIEWPFSPTPLARLSAADQNILVRFAQWLLETRGYAPASARLYLSAVRRWFNWMGVNDRLPPGFPLSKALWALEDALAGSAFRVDWRPPEPPDGIEETITYYDGLTPPEDFSQDRMWRWALTRLRNRALMRVLAESGGRAGEVIQLRVGDFPPGAFETGEVWRVEIVSKGNHRHKLRFWRALPYVKAYIDARGAEPGERLFVSHSKRYDGRPLSRQSVWHVVDAARRGLGLGRIHPHDFRHYCATRLVNAGEPLDVVQDYLGHRSVETTRKHYAHTQEARVDEAVRANPVV